MSDKITVTYKRKRGMSRAKVADGATMEPQPVSSSGVTGSEVLKEGTDADDDVLNEYGHASSSRDLARLDMSAHITGTNNRKHGTTEPPPISSTRVTGSEVLKEGVDSDNSMMNGCDHPTSTQQQDASKSMRESAREETPKTCTHTSEKEQKEIPLREPLPQMEGPDICSASNNLPIAEACINKLQCTNAAVNRIPASSSVCDLRHANMTTNQAEDSNNFAHSAMDSHKGAEDTTRASKCNNRFSPQFTFQRRVKKKINLNEPPERNYRNDNGKGYSTLTCSPPSLSVNGTSLLKETDANSLNTAYKVTTEGTTTGLTVPAQYLLEQTSSCKLKSTVRHAVSTQHTEDENQALTSERDGTRVLELTSVQVIGEPLVKAEELSKTLGRVNEAQKVVERKELHDDPPESQGSTKDNPVIVLDDDDDERVRGKLLESSMVPHQVVQEKNKSRFNLGKFNLNSVDLPQDRFLEPDALPVQRLLYQDHFGTEQTQVSQPFTKEKDVVHGKEQYQEGTSRLHTLYPNMYDLTMSCEAGSSTQPKSMPSEQKFRIMNKVPESSLDLRLDNFQQSGISSPSHDKLFQGGKSSGSHWLTERIGTYSCHRRQIPWSEDELDYLWTGVRRYGTSNWNAMLRDRRLQFSSSRLADDLAEQWNKERRKYLGVDLQSVR